MAVAVKNAPETASRFPLGRRSLVSLAGVVYLLATLSIVFSLLPSLWYGVLGFDPTQAGSIVLLVLTQAAIGVGLLVLGGWMLHNEKTPGVRAGVFVGFVGLLFLTLLARWISTFIESWAYESRWFSRETGVWVTIGVAVFLLILGVRMFLSRGMGRWLVSLENQGWFHATSYKPMQGMKVRRGTILGLLLIAGSGIYTLIAGNYLGQTENWELNIPFTGAVGLEQVGDAGRAIGELPALQRDRVRIKSPGDSRFAVNQFVSLEQYKAALSRAVESQGFPEAVRAELTPLIKGNEVLPLINAVNQLVKDELFKIRPEINPDGGRPIPDHIRGLGPDDVSRLRALFDRYNKDRTTANLAAVIVEFNRQLRRQKEGERPAVQVAELPVAVPVVDRYLLRSINDGLDPKKYVKVGDVGDSNFQRDSIVSRSEFEETAAALKKEDKRAPEAIAPVAATGSTEFATLRLLPAVQYTLPLLLLGLTLWLAWRIVNMPTFADFLIATEAEMNKVSWTTGRRLYQDTIVVLVTVFLMAAFLFVMDQTWRIVLSNHYIGVLRLPSQEASDHNKPVEQKRY